MFLLAEDSKSFGTWSVLLENGFLSGVVCWWSLGRRWRKGCWLEGSAGEGVKEHGPPITQPWLVIMTKLIWDVHGRFIDNYELEGEMIRFVSRQFRHKRHPENLPYGRACVKFRIYYCNRQAGQALLHLGQGVRGYCNCHWQPKAGGGIKSSMPSLSKFGGISNESFLAVSWNQECSAQPQ